VIEALGKVLVLAASALAAERARADAAGRAEIDRLLAEARSLLDAGAIAREVADVAERIDRG